MRIIILFCFISCSTLSNAQDEFQVWTEIGVKGDIIKKMDWFVDVKSRFGDVGLNSFLPEAGINYKVKKWFKPSVSYRFILAPNKYGNYKAAHRINFNANFKTSVKRFELDLRARYQYVASGRASQEYNSDFDQAIRIKPSIEYDINNSIFTPKVSTELFYDPVYGPEGQRFTKIRFAIGSSLELDGPHGFSFKYQLDKWLHDYSHGLRHVLSVSYGYKF